MYSISLISMFKISGISHGRNGIALEDIFPEFVDLALSDSS